MKGIEAQLPFCLSFDEPLINLDDEIGQAYLSVIVQGRIYDPLKAICRKRKLVERDIQPLPPPEDIPTGHPTDAFIRNLVRDTLEYPCNLPSKSEMDSKDFKLLTRFGSSRCSIVNHYIFIDDKETIVTLYGQKIIEEATGEKLEDFCNALDDIIARNTSKAEAVKEYSAVLKTRWLRDIKPFLKKETVKKFTIDENNVRAPGGFI